MNIAKKKIIKPEKIFRRKWDGSVEKRKGLEMKEITLYTRSV